MTTTGAGIRTSGSDIRIEGNNSSGNDIGFDINSAGCIIIRNSAAGNTTNYDIVANNFYGPILDRASAMTAGVTGSSAASTIGTTDPNANWSY